MITIIEDKNQKDAEHGLKHAWFNDNGIERLRYRLPVGDYILVNDKVADVLKRKAARGIEPKMMDFLGTYDVVVDTKRDIQELVGDICGKSHDRFRDECVIAQNNNIQLYILVENKGMWADKRRRFWCPAITCLKDLHLWVNPRLFIFANGKQKYPTATRGVTLMKACMTMEQKYGVKFLFCSPEESGAKVLELLGVKEVGDG